MLTSRERLRRCYFHEELDRPGVYSRTGFPADDPSYDELKAYLAQKSDLKGAWAAEQLLRTEPVEVRVEPYSEEFVRHVNVLHTPAGDLQSLYLVSLRGQPGMQKEFFLKGREDAQRYLSLPVPEIGGEVASFFDAVERMGERGIVEVGLGSNPAGSVVELFGSDAFAMMSKADRGVLHALCERRMMILRRLVRFCVGSGLGPFFWMSGEEYVTPPLHGPDDFQDFNVRYDKPIIDLIHESGGRVHIHCHGSIRRVLGGFIEMGVDVLHPVEPPPMGDVTARQAKAFVRGRICMEGNIQIGDMYEKGPEEIGERTRELIREAFDDRRGLIVCPSASPYVWGEGRRCFPQYKAMIDAVRAWKG